MKISLVNYEYKGQGGGAGQQMFYLARALRDVGHDVSLLIGWDKKFGEPELFVTVLNLPVYIINLIRVFLLRSYQIQLNIINV